MTLRNKQNVAGLAGLVSSAGACVFAAFGLWVGAAIAFAVSSCCWAVATGCADRRRERLGSAVIRETRRVEEHALGEKRRQRSLGKEGAEPRVVAIVAINLRTAISRIIDHA
jgi:hypothetical protein